MLRERNQGRFKSFRCKLLKEWDCHRDEKGDRRKDFVERTSYQFGQDNLGCLLDIQMEKLSKS